MQNVTITIHATVGEDHETATKMLMDYIMQVVRIIDPEALATLTPDSFPALQGIPQSFDVSVAETFAMIGDE